MTANLQVKAQITGMGSADFSDMAQSRSTDYSDRYKIEKRNTDSVGGLEETGWTPDWTKWHGQYRKIPELQTMIDKLASWTFGRGIKADAKNKAKLKKIKGFGKESARVVLKNQWRTAMICGDSFAQIIEDNQKRLINLKPLNPGTIKSIFNQEGIIIRYEQWMNGNEINKFEENEIYHLSYNRIADEIHGIPFSEKLQELILMRNEAMTDQSIVFHRYVKPTQVIEVGTEDTAKLNELQAKFDNTYKKTENILVTEGSIKKIERMSIPQYSTLDPLNWLKYLVRQSVTSGGVPEVVMGWGEETTEASSKIIYLAFQQEIEDMQLYNQEMAELQLGIIINLEFPASIETELKKDNKKDSGQMKELNVNPEKDG